MSFTCIFAAMPLDRIVLPAPLVKVGFWKITEPEEELVQMYIPERFADAIIPDLKGMRKAQFLASRILAQIFCPDSVIIKDTFGKPGLYNSTGHISWSHSGNFAVIITNQTESTGIDIETVGPRILNIQHKFCNKKDELCIHKGHHIECLLIMWGAKESMYKWYGKKEVDFRLHMTVEPFEISSEGRFIATFNKPDLTAVFMMEYQVFEGYVAVWIVEEIKNQTD